MNNIFKKEITIHDKDGKRFDLKITNEWTWEWNRYFSICSQSWQWQFNPSSDIQQKLLDIWNTYHLDRNFDTNFEEDLFKLIEDLIEEEENYSLNKIELCDLHNEVFINYADEYCNWEYEKLMAACLHASVSWLWLENVSCYWDYWDVQWFEYYIYTDEEANESHRDRIENLVDDIWFDALNWMKDIDVDMDKDWYITISKSINISANERSEMLSWYDWQEHCIDINWTTYYLYRNN